MKSIKDTFLDVIKPTRFKTIKSKFVSSNNLFEMIFPVNWKYSCSKKSYYSFSNENLKGGFDISIIRNKSINNEISNSIDYANFLLGFQLQPSDYQYKTFSGMKFLKIKYNPDDTNMNFTSWILKNNGTLWHIRFMIFNEEANVIKEKWELEVNKVLISLIITPNK